MFTGADIRNGKSSIMYESNLCTSAAGKFQACANSVIIIFPRHHFDGNYNTDLQIKNEVVSLCVRSPFG